jgi:hypothetical protein
LKLGKEPVTTGGTPVKLRRHVSKIMSLCLHVDDRTLFERRQEPALLDRRVRCQWNDERDTWTDSGRLFWWFFCWFFWSFFWSFFWWIFWRFFLFIQLTLFIAFLFLWQFFLFKQIARVRLARRDPDMKRSGVIPGNERLVHPGHLRHNKAMSTESLDVINVPTVKLTYENLARPSSKSNSIDGRGDGHWPWFDCLQFE